MKKLLGIIAISAVFSIVLMGCKGSEEGDTAATGTPASTTSTGTTPDTKTGATTSTPGETSSSSVTKNGGAETPATGK